MKRLNSPEVSGVVGNVRDEDSFVKVLQGLAPIDHLVFSGVETIIRGNLEDLDLDRAKDLFNVKFWGAVLLGKCTAHRAQPARDNGLTDYSCQKIRHHQTRWIAYSDLWHGWS